MVSQRKQVIGRVYIVRHGETEENKEGIIQGQTDTQLNELGRVQAEKVGNALQGKVLRAAYSSDLARAVDTARAISGHHLGLTLVLDEALRERAMGRLEGRKAGGGAVNVQTELELERKMETGDDFYKRAVRWWRTVLVPAMVKEPGDVLVVSHGGWIGCVLRDLGRAAKLSVNGRVLNASVTTVEVSAEGRGTIVGYSGVSHLAAAEFTIQENVDIMPEPST